MPATIFGQNSVYNANTFAASFASDGIYLYVGKSHAWANDATPPSSSDFILEKNKIWNNMSGAIRITRDQVALGIKRNNWTSGTVYENYTHDDATLDSGTGFYVLAGHEDRDVYKCLDNNGSSKSTSKPFHHNAAATTELDGYVWKYMYTIPVSMFSRFATANVIPVLENAAVRSFAIAGSILSVPISANNLTGIGKDYRGTGFSNGTVGVSAANATIFTTVLANTATNEIKVIADSGLAIVEDYFANTLFLVTSGQMKGYSSTILKSKPPTTLAATDDYTSNLVLSTMISNIANGDSFSIGPHVLINDDLTGGFFRGFADVNSSGNVTSITTLVGGQGYSNGLSSVTIHGDYLETSNGFSDGSGATANIVISPVGGHGYRSSTELNAKYVILSAETTIPKNHETGTFIGYGNEIRQYGLVRNPMATRTGLSARNTSYDLRTTLYFKSPTVIPFTIGETVNNSLTSATAKGIIDNICGVSGSQYLSLTNTEGTFANGDVLYNNKGYTLTVDSASLENHTYPLDATDVPSSSVISGGLYKYSGELLYNENIVPITRRIDQKENFKIVFEF
jgi:hypothetical protein